MTPSRRYPELVIAAVRNHLVGPPHRRTGLKFLERYRESVDDPRTSRDKRSELEDQLVAIILRRTSDPDRRLRDQFSVVDRFMFVASKEQKMQDMADRLESGVKNLISFSTDTFCSKLERSFSVDGKMRDGVEHAIALAWLKHTATTIFTQSRRGIVSGEWCLELSAPDQDWRDAELHNLAADTHMHFSKHFLYPHDNVSCRCCRYESSVVIFHIIVTDGTRSVQICLTEISLVFN